MGTDFRVELLLGAFYHLCVNSYSTSGHGADTDDAIVGVDNDDTSGCVESVARFLRVWREFGQHPGQRFRIIGNSAIQKYILNINSNEASNISPLPIAVRHHHFRHQHHRQCLMVLIRSVTPSLVLTIQSSDSLMEESNLASTILLDIFDFLILNRTFPSKLDKDDRSASDSSNSDSMLQGWFALVLPLLVQHLQRMEESHAMKDHKIMIQLLALATLEPQLFKINVVSIQKAFIDMTRRDFDSHLISSYSLIHSLFSFTFGVSFVSIYGLFVFSSFLQSCLPLTLRRQLQSSVLSLTPNQQTMAIERVKQIQHILGTIQTNSKSTIEPTEGREDSHLNRKSVKKSKKRVGGESVSSSSSTPSSSLPLSMDFGHFASKKSS